MSLQEVLATSTLFQSLDESQRKRISGVAKTKSYPGNATLFREGDILGQFYVVEKGAVHLIRNVRLWNRDATLRTLVTTIGAGDAFGWSALVEPHIATLSAETLGPCRLVVLEGPALKELLDEDPCMGYRVMTAVSHLLVRRLEATWRSITAERAQDAARQRLPF
jgi:CRP-like cAMP-binding protein